jgi:hypothetical protein
MSSIYKIASARTNGAKSRGPVTTGGKRASAANSVNSTGPVTPDGKTRCSQNATRHGLLADSIVFNGESDDRFCLLLSRLQDELQPETGIEADQVEIMAVSHWRRMRLWSLEKALYIEETRKRCAATGGHGDDDDAPPITHHARSFRSLADESRAIELLNRYETRFSREYLRALACFKGHRADNKGSDKARSEKARSGKNGVKTIEISKQSDPNLG